MNDPCAAAMRSYAKLLGPFVLPIDVFTVMSTLLFIIIIIFGERAFSHAGPATWNALPDYIRIVADPVKFRKLLKSHYFSQAFNIC